MDKNINIKINEDIIEEKMFPFTKEHTDLYKDDLQLVLGVPVDKVEFVYKNKNETQVVISLDNKKIKL